MRWTDRAVRDLRGIYDYVSADNPSAAMWLVVGLVSSAQRLRAFPQSGRVIRRFAPAGAREIIVRPYRIAYRVVGDEVHLLKVHHGARLLHQRDIEEEG